MIANTIFAAGAFASLVAAIPLAGAPHQKRDVVWETETEVAMTTIPVTVTHWLEPGEAAPTDALFGKKEHWGHKGHGHGHNGHGGHGNPPAQTETTAPAAPAPPQSSPESVPEAPAPSSYVQPTTQQAPPPAPTTQQAPPPEPTTQQAPPPPAYTPQTTTQQAAPSAYIPEPAPSAPASPPPSYGGGSSLTGMAASGSAHSGDITYYTPGLGACGYTNTTEQWVVAVAQSLFDTYDDGSGNPNKNPLCGKMVTITGSEGAPFQAEIVDRCVGCQTTDLDLSPKLFETVYPKGNGRVSGVKWAFD